LVDAVTNEFPDDFTEKDVTLLKSDRYELVNRMIDALDSGGTLLYSFYSGQMLLKEIQQQSINTRD